MNGSAKRHRSLSAPRSAKAQRNGTPRNNAVTPQLGKRKRGSSQPVPEGTAEEDELSPDRVENVRSIEKSRRVTRTVSPIREDPNEAPDELSVVVEEPPTVRKTPGLVTGLVPNGSAASASSRRRSKSTDVVPVTPGMQPHSSSRRSFVGSTTVENTASNASQAEEDDADELSPPHDNTTTPRVISRDSIPNDIPREGEEGDVDELSPAQLSAPNTIASTLSATQIETAATPIPIRSARGRPRKSVPTNETRAVATPAAYKPGKQKKQKAVVEAEANGEQEDELSPVTERTTHATPKLAKRVQEDAHISEEESDMYEEEVEEEEDAREPTPKPVAKRTSPKQAQRAKPTNEKPPRKRQRVLGPKFAISVMRMKGYGVRGITVADTTRTLVEEAIDHRLGRILEKMQTLQDSARRKEVRSEVNLALSFKESLSEKLLDLQDANDVLTTNLKKLKIFKRDNAELRKDILALQNGRQEIALEHDDIQAEFEAEKAKIEARNTLSTNMFDIEAAIQNGRKKATQEGREGEGPDVPLSMLLEMVSRDVGSIGGGLLAHVKSFNNTLERAASWLEGRA